MAVAVVVVVVAVVPPGLGWVANVVDPQQQRSQSLCATNTDATTAASKAEVGRKPSIPPPPQPPPPPPPPPPHIPPSHTHHHLGSWEMGSWGLGVLGSWGLGVLGSCVLGSWGAGVLGSWGMGSWGHGVLGSWGLGSWGPVVLCWVMRRVCAAVKAQSFSPKYTGIHACPACPVKAVAFKAGAGQGKGSWPLAAKAFRAKAEAAANRRPTNRWPLAARRRR